MSLASTSFAGLVYQYLLEDLRSIPVDSKNHAQRDATRAMGIAYQLMGQRVPPSYASARSARQQSQWRADVQTLTNQLQEEVLHRVNASSTNTRKRKRTGAVSGILKAWSKMRASASHHRVLNTA
ncbi:TPA: hypothetical protein N0F65_011119 [Lagenidium giganteum]|uniref:Uncharacterized protein n=1 Tax=Lagenidium giganteum TaxID=4803 RepID=A0AAV2ZAW6_9STRA|nr:TPA: hypothetical protein N0F65_011119 [Lagenidium giganteum]